jgi:sterol desaturase/sphingolipid hydroxylase (fatty acid hydroxylase superfamily)
MNLFQLHFLSYWSTSIIFYILDLIVYKNGTVELYKQNKITKNYWKYCHDSIKSALINQIIITYPLLTIIEIKTPANVKINLQIELFRIFLYFIIADLYFFTLHYLAHTRLFYQKIHKFHHRIFSTCAVAALDANPIEHLFINMGSFIIGPIILGGYLLTIKLWLTIATIFTCISHSGYNHYLVGKEHNLHHRLAKYNYGQGLYILDHFFGTYKNINPIQVSYE